MLIFQAVLFALIQALPQNNAAMTFGEALASIETQRSAPATRSQTESGSSAEQQPSAPSSSAEPDPLAALREAGSPEMQALLMEADFLEENVTQQTTLQSESASPSTAPDPEDQVPQAALEVDLTAGIELEPETLESSQELDAQGELMAQVESTPQDYQAGLSAIRPPGESTWRQFWSWETSFFRGDLGESSSAGSQPVVEIIASKLPRTLLLLVPGTLAGFGLGLWLGKRIGWRRRGWLDAIATLGGTAFYTSFPPWLAFLVASVLAVNLRWFPREKLINPNVLVFADIGLNELIMRVLLTLTAVGLAWTVVVWLTRRMYRNRLQVRGVSGAAILLLAAWPWIASGHAPLAIDLLNHLVLPMLILALLSFGETMLIMRTAMAEVMEDDHVAQAKLMGYDDARVRDRHVARVAMLPVLPRFIVQLPLVIIGSFVLESFFAWDGVAQELVRAANAGDLPVLMGILSVVGIGLLLAHVVLDVLTAYLDPRLRTPRRSAA